jgi:hypothetical protein
MENRTFLLFISILIITAGSFIGCDNDGGGGSSQDARVLTENDFSNDPTLRADPEKRLIVMFLEHPDSEKPENDTGGIGDDRIPYKHKRAVSHTFCWEDDDADARHLMVLEDSERNEILKLDVGDCVTEVIVAGDYEMTIHHDGRIEKTHSIFIIPGQNGDLEAKKEETMPEGILDRAGRVLSNILEKLDISITRNVNAQSVDNLNTVLSTVSCVGCDLSGANLAGADLTGANLTGANLTQANLFQADLGGAFLTAANLTEASLVATTLTGADLTGATWCDGSICDQGSTGICETGARFMDNCDGTITDADTGLMWEKKTGTVGTSVGCNSADQCPDPHDVNNTYSWSSSSTGTDFDGTVSTVFLAQLNDVAGGGTNCFAGHCDWRLPEGGAEATDELLTIVDLGACSPCIDPIFGPTSGGSTWEGTICTGSEPDDLGALVVRFSDGRGFCLGPRIVSLSVRAVRNSP